MRNLLLLFIRNGGFVTFFLVELVCFFIIVRNPKQGNVYNYNATRVGGTLLKWQHSFKQYINLADRADSLATQNAALQTMLYNLRNERAARQDTATIQLKDSLSRSIIRPQYEFIAATVLSNSINTKSNWIMLDRGSVDGVTPDMGVVASNGVVGITRHVSPHFTIVMSMLNPQTKISASLSKSGYFGSLSWDGNDPDYMILRDIPKHAVVRPGERVVTSGYSLLFPKDVVIGYTGVPSLKDGSNFYTIPVRLAQSPGNIKDVYIVKNIFYSEIKTLKEQIKDEQ